jgi:hypothetical protein
VAIPSPTIPSFVDGTVVHQADLNALATNLTNLYNYNQGAFNTQRPNVMAVQTVARSIANSTETTMTYDSAGPNVGNMWIASQPTQLTIQIAGSYFIFGQVRYGTLGGATLGTVARGNILINGTNPAANAVSNTDVPFMTVGNGTTSAAWYVANLAAGATVYMSTLQNSGAAMFTALVYCGSFLSAFYIGSST